MTQLCRYGALMSAASLLSEVMVDEVRCDEPAQYKAIVGTDTDGFVVEITTPVCPVHEAHVSQNVGYRRSIKLRERSST
jgi:hypothetical protein